MIATGFRQALAPSLVPSREVWVCVAGAVGALGLLTLWLLALGRPLVCPCGVVRLWAPEQDSQQLADWYSLLHVTFGLSLFVLVRRFQPDWPLSRVMLVALVGSVAWEAIENLPATIALFNPPGASQAYVGDTVLNAMGDSLFVVGGCLLASGTTMRGALLTALGIEGVVWLAIEDGLLVGSARLLLSF